MKIKKTYLYLLIFLTLAASAIYFLISLGFELNSDHALAFVGAREILSGNLLFSDWGFPTTTHYADLIIYAILAKIFGYNEILMYIAPAFTYAAVILFGSLAFMMLPKFHFTQTQGINKEIIQALRDNSLKDGYGSYWNSIIIAAVTGFENEVFQVTSFTYPDKPGIYRFVFTSDRSWYVKPVNYLIVSENAEAAPNINDMEILDFAYSQFGTPQKEVSVSGKKILIWDYDISEKLNHVYLRFRSIKRSWKDGIWEANGKNGSLIGILSSYDKPLKVSFEMNIEGNFDTELYLSGAVNGSVYLKKGEKTYYSSSFILNPGRTNLIFSTPARFKITDLKYDVEKIEY